MENKKYIISDVKPCTINVKISPELKAKILQRKREEGLLMRRVVTDALEEYFQRLEKKK